MTTLATKTQCDIHGTEDARSCPHTTACPITPAAFSRAMSPAQPLVHCNSYSKTKTTARGFKPLRANPSGWRVHLLNLSDTLYCWSASTFTVIMFRLSERVCCPCPLQVANVNATSSGYAWSADSHTVSNAPELVRPPTLSGTVPGWYWVGGPPGKSIGCCQLLPFCL